MTTRLRYVIEPRRDGWHIFDGEEGYDVCPTRVFATWNDAQAERERLEREDFEAWKEAGE